MSFELHFHGGVTSASLTIKPSARARVMRLRVDPRSGSVVLTLPRRASKRRAMEWAAEQRVWIEEALARIPAREPVGPGSGIPLYGIPHVLDWSPDRPRKLVRQDARLLAGGPLEGLESRLYRWLREEARSVLDRETREIAAKAGVSVSRIGVGDPLTRWGSCSASGGIRYSWRLILAPDWVRQATVAHEVAHRAHMNHGPDFHALVAELLGSDPMPARLWLRREGASLHRFGR